MFSSNETTIVGRVGKLVLDYIRQGEETVLSASQCHSPWHVLPPISIDETGCAYTLLMNPSGGLVGGDHLSIRSTLEAKTHVLFSTPSANRIYRSLDKPSIQSVDLKVGSDAVLEWIPDLTIPYAQSKFQQQLHVKIEQSSTVLLWDALASGRVARGERWAFASLENELRITVASRGSVVDRYHLDPAAMRRMGGMVSEWNYIGSFYAIKPAGCDESWKRLQESWWRTLDGCRDRVLGGVSEPAVRGLVVRVLTKSAPDLNSTLQSLWTAARAQLLGLPIPALRKY